MRVIFAGTPDVAVPSLHAFIHSEHEVVTVLTRPDARAGRGRTLRPSPVKELALHHDIPVLTPASLRDDEALRALEAYEADVAAVVAYGNLVPERALTLPRHGWFNLHFSRLPAWRGAAPAQHAILAGESETAMTVFQLEKGLDSGPILAQETVAIQPSETSGELLSRMAMAGADLLVSALDALDVGGAVLSPQEGEPTYAPKITSADARVNWRAPASEVRNHIRAMTPFPGAWTMLNGDRVKIIALADAPVPGDVGALAPGRLKATKKHLFVGTGDEPLALETVGPAGKKAMRAADWARGANLDSTSRFETEENAS